MTSTELPVQRGNQESHLSYPGWKIVLSGFFGVMVSFAAIVPYTFGIFLKPLSNDFGWHREAISAGFSIAALTIAAASPGLGWLLDRFGPRKIVLPCIVIFAATYASLSTLTPNLTRFYVSFFLLGLVGNGTAYLGYSRAISTWFFSRRGIALSLMLAGGGCGAMLLPILTQTVISSYGWRSAYLMLGIAAFIVGFPLAAWFLKERRGSEHLQPEPYYEGGGLTRAVTSRAFLVIAVTVFLYAISTNAAITHLAAILTDRGVSSQAAAFSVSLIGATGLAGRLLTGLFLDRFFGPRVSQIMLFLTVLGIVMLSVAHNLASGLAAAALIGFSMGSEGDITPYLLSRYFGTRKLATLYALTWTTYAIGGATGPLILGSIFDKAGAYNPLTIQLLALPSAVPCLLMFLLPRYRKTESAGEPTSISKITASEIAS